MTRPQVDERFCDANAGVPATPEVMAEFLAVEQAYPGNPASSHAAGRRARGALEAARERIAKTLHLTAADVVFTSGGTEAANLAVVGLGDSALPVLLSPAEHPAVLEPAANRGCLWWSLDAGGFARVEAPTNQPGLLCLVHAQSELGSVQPVAAAAELAKTLDVPLFVDAAQTLGRLPLAPILALGAILSLSPHKCGGLRGHGVLAGHGLASRLRPLLRGGGQEQGLRPGTQSPALAAANALAIATAERDCETRSAAMAAMRSAFLEGLRASGVQHRLLTTLERSIANTAMLQFPGVDGRNLLPALDLAGVQASHGSACSSGAPTPPRVLTAIGLEVEQARACVRFSFDWRMEPRLANEIGHRVGGVVHARQKKN